jgi:hypothetical protein
MGSADASATVRRRTPSSHGGHGIATIATLVVDVIGNTTGLNAGLTKAQTTVSRFGTATNAAMLGAGAAIAGFAVISVNAALDAQEANLKLQNTFQNNAKLSDSSVAAFQKQADALRELTGVDDEAIITGQALLGQFKLTGAQVQELTPLIVDLSSKMGIDLQAAAKAVGKATQGSTGILSRYGIILDEAAVETDAFAAVTEGLRGTVGGFAKQLADEQPWRVFISEIEEVAEQFGKALLPFLQKGTQLLRKLVPILETAANNMGLIVGALAGFAAVKFVPPLLLSIAAGLEAVGAAALANRVLSIGAAIESVGVMAATATPAALAFGAALIGGTAALAAWDPLSLVDDQEALNKRFEEGTLHLGKFTSQTVLGKGPLDALGQATNQSGQAVSEMQAKAGLAAEGILNLGGATAETVNDLKKGGDAADRMGHRLRELRNTTMQSVEDQLGALDGLRNKWELTTHAAIADMRSMVKMAQEMARDFKRLDEEAIPRKFQEWLIQQGPAAVHAFVNGTAQQKDRWVSLWKEFEGATTRAVANARNAAVVGGRQIGSALVVGLRNTIQQYTGTVSAQAAFMVRDAIAAARAAAGAKSPSKEMIALGVDIVQGLIDGIRSRQSDLNHELADIERRLDSITSKASELRSAISGGFGQFLDLSGAAESGDIAGLIKEQLRGARQFTDVMEALRRRGASAALIGQIAGLGENAVPVGQQLLQAGPGAIQQANRQYAAILKLQQETSNQLTQAFFGDRIEAVREEFHKTQDILRTVERRLDRALERLEKVREGDIVIKINETELARASRDALNRQADRNAGTRLR